MKTQNTFQKLSKLLCAATFAMVSASVFAQVGTDDVKVGTVLDASGIKMLGYGGKALPLPPGAWEVIHRIDGTLPLTGGTVSSAPKVELTLRNTSVGASNIAAMVVTYSPEVIRIRWNNSKCESTNASVVEDNGTTTGSINYICTKATYNTTGGKKYVQGSETSTNAWIKAHVPPLLPYINDIPDANVWISIVANHDRGRIVAFDMIAKSNGTVTAGDAFDQEIRAWVKATGAAVVSFMDNDASSIGGFPTAK